MYSECSQRVIIFLCVSLVNPLKWNEEEKKSHDKWPKWTKEIESEISEVFVKRENARILLMLNDTRSHTGHGAFPFDLIYYLHTTN